MCYEADEMTENEAKREEMLDQKAVWAQSIHEEERHEAQNGAKDFCNCAECEHILGDLD